MHLPNFSLLNSSINDKGFMLQEFYVKDCSIFGLLTLIPLTQFLFIDMNSFIC